jgi:hypothetical protein
MSKGIVKDPKYLAYIRQQNCYWCGFPGPNAVHHVGAEDMLNKRKSRDDIVLPACDWSVNSASRDCHHVRVPRLTKCEVTFLRIAARQYYKEYQESKR